MVLEKSLKFSDTKLLQYNLYLIVLLVCFCVDCLRWVLSNILMWFFRYFPKSRFLCPQLLRKGRPSWLDWNFPAYFLLIFLAITVIYDSFKCESSLLDRGIYFELFFIVWFIVAMRVLFQKVIKIPTQTQTQTCTSSKLQIKKLLLWI